MDIAFVNDVLSTIFLAITVAALLGPMLFALYEAPFRRWIGQQQKRVFKSFEGSGVQALTAKEPPEPLEGFERLID